MRVLVVGAGGVGGYFGGRLLEAGQDVTFLVRPRRAAQLAEVGLVIRSQHGDVRLPAATVTAEALGEPYDLILLACKAYDLPGAMESFAPAVGRDSVILPLLNGMRHLDDLEARFGRDRVLGGLCMISAALDPEGRILHLNDAHSLTFGERDGSRSPRAEAIAATMAGARFESRLSEAIVQEMWEKWVFLAALAGITCLMRAPVGAIVEAGGAGLAAGLLDECAAIAAAQGCSPRPSFLEGARRTLTTPGSSFAASMLRDLERNAPTEADHVLGDLLRRDPGLAGDRSLLRIAYTHMKASEVRRMWETQ
jgi:2-dehydropantoate 2-reductase